MTHVTSPDWPTWHLTLWVPVPSICGIQAWSSLCLLMPWHLDTALIPKLDMFSSKFLWLLTHLPLHKMADILADDIFTCIFLNENDRITIQISLKFVPKSPINNKSVLVQVTNGLAPNRRQAINWTNDDPICWPIYAAQGGDKLKIENTVPLIKWWFSQWTRRFQEISQQFLC